MDWAGVVTANCEKAAAVASVAESVSVLISVFLISSVRRVLRGKSTKASWMVSSKLKETPSTEMWDSSSNSLEADEGVTDGVVNARIQPHSMLRLALDKE